MLLGDPRLHETSTPLLEPEHDTLESTIDKLHETLMAFREKYGAGRAIDENAFKYRPNPFSRLK